MAMACETSLHRAIRVVSWNCLAHIHTHWNAAVHLAAPLPGSSKPLESQEQRHSRHRRIIAALKRLDADVALLQEVDKHFIPQSWGRSPGESLPCGALLDGYVPYRNYNSNGEGTIVLLKSEVFFRDPEIMPVQIKATMSRGSKTAMVVHARLRQSSNGSASAIAFASVHLRYGDAAAQQTLLADTVAAVRPGCPLVLGGDFNVEASNLVGTQIEIPLSLAGLVRVSIDCHTSLGPCTENGFLPTDSMHTIDHIYIPAGTLTHRVDAGTLPSALAHPRGPWGDGPSDGSDHAWILAEIQLQRRNQ